MVKTSIYVSREQLDALHDIQRYQFINVSVLIRQGIDHIIACYTRKKTNKTAAV